METTLKPWSPGIGFSAWDSAGNYVGDRPEGYYVYTTHRDADLLTNSNYDAILKALNTEDEKAEIAGLSGGNSVREFDFGHWAVGWTRQIVVDKSAPESVIRLAEELLAALDDYPILDESDYSEREWNAAADLWESTPPREKVQAAIRERDRCHWLKSAPAWIYGRMDWHTLVNHGSDIAEYLSERFRTYATE